MHNSISIRVTCSHFRCLPNDFGANTFHLCDFTQNYTKDQANTHCDAHTHTIHEINGGYMYVWHISVAIDIYTSAEMQLSFNGWRYLCGGCVICHCSGFVSLIRCPWLWHNTHSHSHSHTRYTYKLLHLTKRSICTLCIPCFLRPLPL